MIVTVPGPGTPEPSRGRGLARHFADTLRFDIPDDITVGRWQDSHGITVDDALAALAADRHLVTVSSEGPVVTAGGDRHKRLTGASAYRPATPEETATALAAAREKVDACVAAARERLAEAERHAALDRAILDKVEALTRQEATP